MVNRLHQTINAPKAVEEAYRTDTVLTGEEILQKYETSPAGLTESEADLRLEKYGPNEVLSKDRGRWYMFLLKAVLDEFILVLLLLAVVSLVLKDPLGAVIIFFLASISAMIRFSQDYHAYLESEKLKTMIHTTVDVRRENVRHTIPMDELTLGDMVELGSGSLIPADLYLLSAKDLFLAQSMFTGESIPVEKSAVASAPDKTPAELTNICLMGANVVSGSGLGVVIRLGKDTYLGHIAQTLEQGKGKTNFELGLAKITKTMIRYMIFVVAGVFLINGFYKKDWLSAFMFSISVAVGITPGMLPMIVNATLSKGAQFLAKKKTIVKNISAIQNLGAIDVLCTDKTGTLTEDAIVLHRYMDVHGNDEREILDYAYLNSYFSTGIKNLIDRAILKYGETHGVQEDVSRYRKIDEIPFDYTRKRMSVVIENGEGKHRLITKGALEEIVKICASVRIEGKDEPLEESHLKEVQEHADELNREGMHVIAIAEKHVQIDVKTFSPSDEGGLTFLGYAAFLDPPKSDVGNAIQGLLSAGVDIKVISGDAPLVVEHIAREVGIPAGETLLGEYIEQLSEEDLRAKVETARIFARVSPLEKQRIVDALKVNGHVVGYMGDGVNDAPSIRHADVGISVDNATDVAKESADIILLEKSLTVLLDGIFEGRRVYGNVVKYMKMALSSNFGNVFSVLAASLLLPFLPMIPIQILIQNLIYDGTQIAIPWDRVDEEFLKTPKKWDTASLSRFMNVMGAVSSVFDLVIFGILWFVLGYATISQQTFFQTGWFIEGLISQSLIVHFIRTSKISFLQSRADIRLLLSSALGILAALLIPMAMHQITSFHFEIMPPGFYGYLLLTLTSYAIVIELVKKLYIRRTGGWL